MSSSLQSPRDRNIAIGQHFSILQSRLTMKDKQALLEYLPRAKDRLYGVIVETSPESVTMLTTSPIDGYHLVTRPGNLKRETPATLEPAPIEGQSDSPSTPPFTPPRSRSSSNQAKGFSTPDQSAAASSEDLKTPAASPPATDDASADSPAPASPAAKNRSSASASSSRLASTIVAFLVILFSVAFVMFAGPSGTSTAEPAALPTPTPAVLTACLPHNPTTSSFKTAFSTNPEVSNFLAELMAPQVKRPRSAVVLSSSPSLAANVATQLSSAIFPTSSSSHCVKQLRWGTLDQMREAIQAQVTAHPHSLILLPLDATISSQQQYIFKHLLDEQPLHGAAYIFFGAISQEATSLVDLLSAWGLQNNDIPTLFSKILIAQKLEGSNQVELVAMKDNFNPRH